METVSSCSSCSTTKGVDHCFIMVYLLGQNPVSARETESKGCGLYHQVDVSVLCNTISSVRILSCFVKCGHCLLLLQIFTSGLFPLLLGRGSLECPGHVRELPEGSGRRELEDSQRKFNGCGSFPIKGFSLCSLSFPRDLHPAKAWDSPMSC